jgi:hypothetical protein
MPDWANKLTVICIGAGGGGGGGGAGNLHEYPHGMWTKFEDNRIPATVGREMGHDIIFGGGGGAGGNIAWTEYKNVPAGTKFTANIGLGGAGGLGCENQENMDYVFVHGPKSRYYTEYDYAKLLFLNYCFPQGIQENKALDSYEYFQDALLDKDDTRIQSITRPRLEFERTTAPFVTNGGDGGYTSFKSTLPTGYQVHVSADGGLGGANGFGIKNYWHQYHTICWDPQHNYVEGLIPGGGSQLTEKTIGENILIGGPGGYGISMPYLDKINNYYGGIIPSNLQNFVESINDYTTNPIRYYRNTAPSLPFGTTDIVNTPNFENKPTFRTQPVSYPYYGRSNAKLKLSIPIGDDVIVHDFSKTFPDKMGNTGGGGGTGKAYYGIFNRSYVGIGYPDENTPFDPGEQIYDQNGSPWFIKYPAPFPLGDYTYEVRSTTKIGKGGRNTFNNDLLSMIDSEFRGITYFGEGGDGGHVDQWMNSSTGELVTSYREEPLQYTQVIGIMPENGNGKGAGGGGGAGTYSHTGLDSASFQEINMGQVGGNGGDGRVILIVESD